MDTYELIRRGELELASGSRLAGKTLGRARREALKQRDTRGLEQLLVLARRLDDGGDLTRATEQSLRLLSAETEDEPDGPKRVALAAGVSSVGVEHSGAERSEAGEGKKHPRRVTALLGVLLIHCFGALTWVVFLGFSSDIGTERQANEAFAIGAATWLVAALVIVWLWWSGRSPLFWFVSYAWWLPSFLLMVAVVYGW